MRQLEVDGAGGEHDEGQGGVGGMEPVGPADDEADLGVEALDPAVGDPCSTALRIISRRWRMVLATLTNGASRDPGLGRTTGREARWPRRG